MPVKELLKNGKIPKKEVPRVLRLVRIFFNSLYASYLDREYYLHRIERLHRPGRPAAGGHR